MITEHIPLSALDQCIHPADLFTRGTKDGRREIVFYPRVPALTPMVAGAVEACHAADAVHELAGRLAVYRALTK